MDNPNQTPAKPFREWQIIGLILIALTALALGQAVKKRPPNFQQVIPKETPATPEITKPPTKQATTTLRLPATKAGLNQAIFIVDLAQTSNEQTQGLSGRVALKGNEGMLFVYSTSTAPDFWMKDMNFPLDIIWIDQNKKIIEITPNISPNTFPTTFSPKKPVRYVLEVPADTAAKNNLKIGDLIHFSLQETL
jgi:hypothetical protein